MPRVEVACSISNCTYYGEGNICTAERIMVEMDRHAKYDTEFSSELTEKNHTDQVRTSRETCCKTFKPQK